MDNPALNPATFGYLSDPIDKLMTRLQFHAGAGQMLAGWRLETAQVRSVEGAADVPVVRFKIPTAGEVARGSFVIPSMTIVLTLSTRRTTSPNAITEHCKALEMLMDAIDLDASGIVDPGLEGTLRLPVSMRTGQQYALDLTVNTELTLTLEPRAAARGSRRQ